VTACPVCPASHVCSSPWACQEETDSRAYRFCEAHGFSADVVLDSRMKGLCANLAGSWACAGVGALPMCVPAPEDCSPDSDGVACGEISCGPGCSCLCENVCWCGQ
jgi:hypothetical protein